MKTSSFFQVLSEALSQVAEEVYAPSHAEQLLDLDKTLKTFERCGCSACLRGRRQIKSTVNPNLIRLARRLGEAPIGVQFRALFEGWTASQLAKNLGVK